MTEGKKGPTRNGGGGSFTEHVDHDGLAATRIGPHALDRNPGLAGQGGRDQKHPLDQHVDQLRTGDPNKPVICGEQHLVPEFYQPHSHSDSWRCPSIEGSEAPLQYSLKRPSAPGNALHMFRESAGNPDAAEILREIGCPSTQPRPTPT